jgi:anti-anti-sigma factor
MRILVRRTRHHTIVAIRGDLDRAAAADLRERLLVTLRHTVTPLIIDLSEVSFSDAAGLALLIGTRRRAHLQGLAVCLAAPSPRMSELLAVTGLNRAFAIHASVAAAERSGPPSPTDPTVIGDPSAVADPGVRPGRARPTIPGKES